MQQLNTSTPRKEMPAGIHASGKKMLPEQDTHLEHSKAMAPPTGSACPPLQADLNDGLLNTGLPEKGLDTGAVQNLLSLWNSLRRHQLRPMSPPGCALLSCYDSYWQGLHFSWCHLLAMVNTIVINHVHEAFG